MEINRKNFPPIISDNEEIFFSILCGLVESIDELSCMQITKLSDGYHFRIVNSLPKYNDMMLKEILNFHTMYNIHLDVSKSIKTTGAITFKINI